MSMSAWETRCRGLAEELRAACLTVLTGAELRVDASIKDMLAEEEDPNVVPFYPIGTIYGFRVQERRTRHLFGRSWLPWRSWATLASFHFEEMWDAPRWTSDRGVKCCVTDERVAPALMPILERFARDNRLLFRAAWPQKDP
jgi:hypothetical protein